MVEVKLTIEDYQNIGNWYEFAFGKIEINSKKYIQIRSKNTDHITLRKLSVMAQSKLDGVNESW